MIKTTDAKHNRKHTDFAHFVVHTGKGKRGKWLSFKEFYAPSVEEAKEQVLDYLYNSFDIDDETMLITHSDGGIGYAYKAFWELASDIGIAKGKHHYFWDRWHVFHYIKEETKDVPQLRGFFIEAVKENDKAKLLAALDTMEGLIANSEEEQEKFRKFKNRLLVNFRHTRTSEQRHIPYPDYAIIEALHKKVTFRMKRRGMYWSIQGALTMIQLIIMKKRNELHEFQSGSWIEKYEQIEAEERLRLLYQNENSDYEGRNARVLHTKRPYTPKA